MSKNKSMLVWYKSGTLIILILFIIDFFNAMASGEIFLIRFQRIRGSLAFTPCSAVTFMPSSKKQITGPVESHVTIRLLIVDRRKRLQRTELSVLSVSESASWAESGAPICVGNL